MQVGEKLLEEPKTIQDAQQIFDMFDFDYGIDMKYTDTTLDIRNAKRLVELNNEVYKKINNRRWLEQQIFHIDYPQITEKAKEYYDKIRNEGAK